MRWLAFFLIAAVVAGLAGWMARTPGAVSIEWFGYRLETSAAVLVFAVAVAALLAFLGYRVLAALVRAPTGLRRARRQRHERDGYEALSRGLVAIAAGDPTTAAKQAQRASALLENRPLTMLLSAQAAQLQGDDQAAARFFAAMRERSGTEFLGVRGLLTQALKRQDWPQAQALAEEAYRVNPASEWVVSTLYELQKRLGRFADAEQSLERSVRLKALPAADAARERAELLFRQSESAGEDKKRWLARAFKADPGYVPATAAYARLLIGEDRKSRAADAVEKAWAVNPAPELADVYWDARSCDDALKKVQAAQRLAAQNPGHVESRLAIAVAALEARLWGEARSALEPLANDPHPLPRVCRLMAELEEAEHGDLTRARTWLMRATEDEHGPAMSSPVPDVIAPAASS